MVKVPRINAPVGQGVSSKKGSKAIENRQEDVKRIQKMLKDTPADKGGTPDLEITGQIAGPKDPTVKAIRKFQQRKFGWQDGVVDPESHTETALQAIAGGKDDPEPPKPTVLPLDIILRFTGGPGDEKREEAREKGLTDQFNTEEYLKTHQPLKAICFTGFREQEKFVPEGVKAVVDLRTAEATKAGVTIVIGSSAGGVSALKAAKDLTAKGIKLHYVGINDAAFLSSKNEVTFKPAFAINLANAIGAGAITADLAENFFQTIGHNFQHQKDSPTGFFAHAEFHGPLTGFQNVDLKDKPRVVAVKLAFDAAQGASPITLPVAVRDRFAALIHKQAGGSAENLIAPRISALIKP